MLFLFFSSCFVYLIQNYGNVSDVDVVVLGSVSVLQFFLFFGVFRVVVSYIS